MNERLRKDNRPLYEIAKDSIMNLIVQAQVGDQLPSEEELSKRYGISRNTLREAIKILAREGWIVQRQGVGTFINKLPQAISNGLERLESIEAMARRNNWQCSTLDLKIKNIIANDDICNILDIPLDTTVTQVERVKTINGRKVAYLIDIFPHSLLSKSQLEESFDGSILELLIEDEDITIDYAYTELVPILAKDEFAQKLDVDRNTILLLAKETLYSNDGKPLEYALSYMVSEFFNFHVIRRLERNILG